MMMIKQTYWTAIPVVGWMVMLAGCSQAMTDAFFAASVADSRKFHNVAADRLNDHDTNMTEQHKKMHPEAAADIDKLKAEFDAKLVELKKRSDDIHSSVVENANKLIAAGLKLATTLAGLPDGASITGFVSNLVGTETDDVRRDLVAGLKVVNTAADKEAEKRAAAMKAMKAEIMAAAEARLAQLTEETRLKLASTSPDTLARLQALKDNEAAFRETLRKELELTPEQVEEFKGMTTEQILAMIAAAGGAAGLGIAGGRGGKSRSHGDIERLKESFGRLNAEIERAKPPQI